MVVCGGVVCVAERWVCVVVWLRDGHVCGVVCVGQEVVVCEA